MNLIFSVIWTSIYVVNLKHLNNWAVIVDTSRYWYNYRHAANALSIYRSVKRLGIPDSNIILMLGDDAACDLRNPFPATVFNNEYRTLNIYESDIEADYRGREATVENFVRLLTNRLPDGTPKSKRLLSDENSNILIYISGHGGVGFLKFLDSEEISNTELADIIEQMWQKKRYNEILFMVDSCKSASMFAQFYSPNVLGLSSSRADEDGLSHHIDQTLGVYVMDRFTHHVLHFLEKISPDSKVPLSELFACCPKRTCISTVTYRTDLFNRNINEVPITDFFGSTVDIKFINNNVSQLIFMNNVTNEPKPEKRSLLDFIPHTNFIG